MRIVSQVFITLSHDYTLTTDRYTVPTDENFHILNDSFSTVLLKRTICRVVYSALILSTNFFENAFQFNTHEHFTLSINVSKQNIFYKKNV